MNTKQPVILAVVSLSFMSQVSLQASDDHSSTRSVPPPAHTTVDLSRGISIDRQFRTIPPKPIMRITREDIQLIKSMGFGFVKLIINPEPLMSDNRLNKSKWYLKEIVQRVVEEGLPVVVCIHPEWEFKKAILSDPGEFARLLGFIEDVGKFLARGWGPKEVVLQLMTEPGANAMDWNDLQPRLWRAARRAMPEHTLILAGDQVGKIEGLITTKPVDDANVVYSFTFYDPFVLTLQGAEWLTPKLWSHLGDVPYPSDPDMIAQRMPSILGNIPANPAEWRPTVKRLLTDYGNAKWNRERIATRVKKLVDWNESHGGGLKIWCAEFGCYQRTIGPEDRYRYIKDLREVFEENGIG
jgi:endoglucanase